jgi:hypothetical protein
MAKVERLNRMSNIDETIKKTYSHDISEIDSS